VREVKQKHWAKGDVARATAGLNDSYELREPADAYEAVFGGQNEELTQEKASLGAY
jgi:hypothetical protein